MPLYAIKREKELQHQSQALTVSHLLNTLTYVPLLYMDEGLRWCMLLPNISTVLGFWVLVFVPGARPAQ